MPMLEPTLRRMLEARIIAARDAADIAIKALAARIRPHSMDLKTAAEVGKYLREFLAEIMAYVKEGRSVIL